MEETTARGNPDGNTPAERPGDSAEPTHFYTSDKTVEDNRYVVNKEMTTRKFVTPVGNKLAERAGASTGQTCSKP